MDQYLNEEEIFEAYEAATEEAEQWRREYPEYERLADNGLLDEDDENLPEVNDGSLAASLFKIAKRVIKKKMGGRATAVDRDDQWLTELANIYWEKKILKNAKSKASPRRKWKDIARKAAIFGGQPIITLFVQNGRTRGADFIAPYAQDVKLEAGKDSDTDSDILFWDVYYTKLGLRRLIAQAKQEKAEAAEELKQWQAAKAEYDQQKQAYDLERASNPDMPEMPAFEEDRPQPYNKWNIPMLEKIAKSDPGESRPGNETPSGEQAKGVKKVGYHFFISFQRGVGAPFNMCYPSESKKIKKCSVREWSNPDPTGDVPIHYLYFYQDFVNPYGIGIVKLAGGTQNVLDYFRKIDVLATQLGVRPPKLIYGDEDDVDEESMVMAQDANWYVGNTKVEPWQMANGVYNQLPARVEMYQTSLQKMIPIGDSTISSANSGDPNVGRTPQALKMAAASLSIDDEDFSENVDEAYEAVAASMINTEFANMQGSDILKLSEDERDILEKAGIPFELDEEGNKSLELEILWDEARAEFEFEMDADADKVTDDATKLEGLTNVANFLKDPATQQFIAGGQEIILGSKKLNPGELIGEIINLTTENDKILVDATPEDLQNAQAEKAAADQAAAIAAGGMPTDPNALQPGAEGEIPMEGDEERMPLPSDTFEDAIDPNALTPEEEEAGAKIQELVELYKVDPQVAAAMLEAEDQGYEPEEVLESMERAGLVPEGTLQQMLAQQEQGEVVNV